MTQHAASLERLHGLAGAFRLITRVWFDLLAPLAMIFAVTRGDPPVGTTVLVLAMFVLFHAGHTYFNDLTDLDVDRHSTEVDRNRRALVSRRTSPRDVAVTGGLLVAASMICAALLAGPVLLLMVTALALVLGYNFPPLRFSGRPLATQLFWPAMWALMYAVCSIAVQADAWTDGLAFLAFVIVFMGLGESITQDTRDADNDAAGGRRTTVVVYGIVPTATFAFAMQALSLVPLVWFLVDYPIHPAVGVACTLTLLIWLKTFWSALTRLRTGYNKGAARLTHVGSIQAFTVINALIIAGTGWL